jgi:hypothetical protein
MTAGFIPNPKLRLREQLAEVMRFKRLGRVAECGKRLSAQTAKVGASFQLAEPS